MKRAITLKPPKATSTKATDADNPPWRQEMLGPPVARRGRGPQMAPKSEDIVPLNQVRARFTKLAEEVRAGWKTCAMVAFQRLARCLPNTRPNAASDSAPCPKVWINEVAG